MYWIAFSSVMAMRVAIIGCGAVAAIHAKGMAQDASVELAAVYCPNFKKASAFALVHNIRNVSASIGEALATADVAIICSPSSLHFEQAEECIRAGVHTLVELPACMEVSGAEELGESARKQGVQLGCAHTARYLFPYAEIKLNLQRGVIGEIREANYIRYHRLQDRNWTDNALLHHAAHAIDLVLDWCGELDPIACIAVPNASDAQIVSILGKLPGGGPAAITVSYASQILMTRMMVVGDRHTVETDGFSYMHSNFADMEFHGSAEKVYEKGIHDQDRAFLAACRGISSFVRWADTVKLIRTVNLFRALCGE